MLPPSTRYEGGQEGGPCALRQQPWGFTSLHAQWPGSPRPSREPWGAEGRGGAPGPPGLGSCSRLCCHQCCSVAQCPCFRREDDFWLLLCFLALDPQAAGAIRPMGCCAAGTLGPRSCCWVSPLCLWAHLWCPVRQKTVCCRARRTCGSCPALEPLAAPGCARHRTSCGHGRGRGRGAGTGARSGTEGVRCGRCGRGSLLSALAVRGWALGHWRPGLSLGRSRSGMRGNVWGVRSATACVLVTDPVGAKQRPVLPQGVDPKAASASPRGSQAVPAAGDTPPLPTVEQGLGGRRGSGERPHREAREWPWVPGAGPAQGRGTPGVRYLVHGALQWPGLLEKPRSPSCHEATHWPATQWPK